MLESWNFAFTYLNISKYVKMFSLIPQVVKRETGIGKQNKILWKSPLALLSLVGK
jgi:hypothetical protein